MNPRTVDLPVSIIVPAYNAAGTIPHTLASVQSQTHTQWETIVINDGSTDDTGKQAQIFATRDKRFRVVTQANGGESAARNAGLSHARHDWLLFLDADDWIAPRHLQRMTAALAESTKLDAVHCGFARVAADGSEVEETYQPPIGDLFSTLARRAAFPIHACVVRKALVDEVGGFDTTLRTSPDWDLWQRVARTGACFGAVREVLAYYRMSPQGASLDAVQVFNDGMRVLRRGAAADPRVPRPHPDHANGWLKESLVTQEFYLLSWCAGLLLGAGCDALPLLNLVGPDRFPEIDPDAVAQCIFEAAPLPTCQAPRAWDGLWPTLRPRLEAFLGALERQTQASGLSQKAMAALRHRILMASPTWNLIQEGLSDMRALFEEERRQWQELAEGRERDRQNWKLLAEDRDRQLRDQSRIVDDLRKSVALLEETRANWERLAHQRDRQLQEQSALVHQLHDTQAALEAARSTWQQAAEERQHAIERHTTAIAELNADRAELRRESDAHASQIESLRRSDEHRLGDWLLNRFGLRHPGRWARSTVTAAAQRLNLLRLASERLSTSNRHRVVATACDVFPIYSQTFVYQELTQLARQEFDIRFIYSKLDNRDYLQTQFDWLWGARRRLFLNTDVNRADLAYYQRRSPEKVDWLIERLCDASGLSRSALIEHWNFLQGFSFTRMVQAYRAEYLHSYFFYDRSLMTLIASQLLKLPRGISCYADHVLRDYELKVVPLHLELCDIVIATSERIKQELVDLAPGLDSGRIVVKPNGIDTDSFPELARSDPSGDEPFRLISLCRIEPKKGLLDLVDAVHQLRSRGLRVEAHIVGTVDEWSQASRDYKARLDQRITELNLWGKVHLEGRHNLEGIQRFLSISHVFVAPFVETESGDKDGIPTAVLEGMSTGLPTVTTDVGSISEVIEHGRNGLLTSQRQPAALADAIEELLKNPDQRRQLGRQAAETVRLRFDVRRCEGAFHDRLRALIRNRRA